MIRLILAVFTFVISSVGLRAETQISPVCSRQSAPIGLPADPPPAAEPSEVDANTPVARAVLALAYAIENGLPDPYLGVSPNFDGKGLSLGLIQFNLGGSVQKTFGGIPQRVYRRTMPTWGTRFYRAVHEEEPTMAIQDVLPMQIFDEGSKKWRVRPVASRELKAFLGSRESREAQDVAVAGEYRKGYARALQWARARGANSPSPREIASFVDNQVFSGGYLGGVWIEQAKAFRASFKDDGEMVAFVSAWLRSCPYDDDDPNFLYGGPGEAERDAAAWTRRHPKGQNLPDERALLFAFGFVRALTANGPPDEPQLKGIFKAQVVERRGIMALGDGTANGVRWPGGVLE